MVNSTKNSSEKVLASKIPIVEHLSQVYQDTNNSLSEIHKPRYIRILENFKNIYGLKPQFYVRAPGRVGIIGGHIDYCRFSVIPAALEHDFKIAYVTTDDN